MYYEKQTNKSFHNKLSDLTDRFIKQGGKILFLDEILSDNIRISRDVTAQLKPLQHFSRYLRSGYYPFFKEVPELYYIRLGEVINTIIDTELPLLRKVDVAKCYKIKQMLLAIAEESPFIPNIRNLYHEAYGISRMQKPAKIFLENTNISFAMGSRHPARIIQA